MPVTPIDEKELQGRAAMVLNAATPGSTLSPLQPLQGGMSSITYRATWATGDNGSRDVVVKVALAGLAPVKNRDMLRQARIQKTLQGTGVPAPRVLGEHPGSPPEVPPFFVMEFVEGDCVEPNSLPEESRLPADEVRQRELEAARIVGVLHSLETTALGIGDEPVVGPAEELDRWAQSFASCDEDQRKGTEDIRDRLAATMPPPAPSTLIHGDFRLGNTLSSGTSVLSVIDWEIWAVADPRVDLSWFLMMNNPDPALGRPTADGMPGNDELLAVYEEARRAKVTDLDWFAALVRYKQAAIMALIARNARRRGAEGMEGDPTGLLASARELLRVG